MSKRGKPQIVDSRGYIYCKERTHPTGKTYWICIKRHSTKCNARPTTFDGKIVNYNGQHNHLPPENLYSKLIQN